jgi:cellulose synthase/poly-beta-1,6-N-acetylglucosamine synthase-like glycosyltransferase
VNPVIPIFILSSGILVLAYPILWLATKIIPRPKPIQSPRTKNLSFTIVVAAYNEEAVIEQKISNFLAIDYPADKLNMLIVSDCSTDATDAMVSHCGSDRVRLINYGERLGKTRILNRVMQEIESDIVVMTDANILFDQDAIQAFTPWFSDPKVGLVCGWEDRQVPEGARAIQSEATYREFEVLIKEFQSRFGAVMGAHGGLYSIRRECWRPLPDNALSNDDLLTGMNVLKQAKSVCFERRARGLEVTGTEMSDEFRRRVRIGAGNFQCMWWHPWLLNPFVGWRSLMYWIHKVPRWLTPHLMFIAFISNALLIKQAPLWGLLLALQVGFYLMATLGLLLNAVGRGRGKWMAPAHFCSMNWAIFLGFVHWLRGIEQTTWSPTNRK